MSTPHVRCEPITADCSGISKVKKQKPKTPFNAPK